MAVIAAIGNWAVDVVGHDYFVAATALLFGSAILGAFFDTIPYAATMAPIVEGLVAQDTDPVTGHALWWPSPWEPTSADGTAVARCSAAIPAALSRRALIGRPAGRAPGGAAESPLGP